MDQRERDGDEHGRADAGDGRAGDGGGGRPRKRCGKHLAFKADINHARALGIKAGECGQDQRHGDADSGLEEDDERVVIHDQAPAAASLRDLLARAKNAVMAGRNICSSAPAKRMTRPWMTTIMSRVISGMSKESSAPP